MSGDQDPSAASPRVPLGGDYWDAEPAAPVWGFADLHAHLMAHLAFGGKAFWGLPYDPVHTGEEAMAHALPSCEPIHGGLINVNPEFGHPAGGGWPEFEVWPRFTSLVHQQAYIDWLYRAYQGGLRLVTCLAVNNELLATKTSGGRQNDDRSAIQAQVVGMRKMAAFVDKQAGGAGQGWMRIVYSAKEARQAIAENKLAVVLGIEVDSFGNWHKPQDLDDITGGDLDEARRLIGAELDWLYGLGIRQITPIHLTNNAFGGTAIYLRLLETVNLFLTGEGWHVEDAFEHGIRYRMDYDGTDTVDDLERTVMISGRKRMGHRATLMENIPGVYDLLDAAEVPRGVEGGHANVLGLNEYGIILLDEMMKRGLVLDLDHMSEKSTNTALAMAEARDYPVILSHCWFRDLLFSAQSQFNYEKHAPFGTSDVHKVAHEAAKPAEVIERIAKLGGVVAPILNQGDIFGLGNVEPELAKKIPEPCAGSSTSFAQALLYAAARMGGRGVAMGSDINGAAALPGPRFGTNAGYYARDDRLRRNQRRGEIDRQTNGVRYTEEPTDTRWFRFPSSGLGGYDEDERDIWEAVAEYHAGFNPWTMQHDASELPDPTFRQALEHLKAERNQEQVDDLNRGFWAAEMDVPGEETYWKWSELQRAGYLSKAGTSAVERGENARVRELEGKIKAIWAKWDEMNGDNRPLAASKAGPRDFNINIDGMAHYGLLPDLLQDMRNSGLSAGDLAPFFRSAYDYTVMWAKCEERITKK
ncbi:MAG: membrane dipeptidase [Anaerolineae bacterium]